MRSTVFNKNSIHPPIEGPLTQEHIDAGFADNWVNPRPGKSHGLPPPPAPGSDEFIESETMLQRAAVQVERNQWPFDYMEWLQTKTPEIQLEPGPIMRQALASNYMNPKEAARLVRMDHPAELWIAVARWCIAQGFPMNIQAAGKDFLGPNVVGLGIFASELNRAMQAAFDVKYYYMAPRPEECNGVGTSFTQYEEGCPAHPEYVAGHGAAAGSAFKAAQIVWDIPGDDLLTLMSDLRHFAHYRDFARVHFDFSSRAGFDLGAGLIGGCE